MQCPKSTKVLLSQLSKRIRKSILSILHDASWGIRGSQFRLVDFDAPSIQKLLASRVKLSTIPRLSLQCLTLINVKLDCDLYHLTSLQHLNVDMCGPAAIVEQITTLTQLRTLRLNLTRRQTWDLKHMVHLTELSMDGGYIQQLPASIQRLDILRSNYGAGILDNLTRLTDLSMGESVVGTCVIPSAPHLTTLEVRPQNNIQLPAAKVFTLKQVKLIGADDKAFTNPNLESLSALTVAGYHHDLTEVYPFCSSLTELRFITLHCRQDSAILAGYTNLKTLTLDAMHTVACPPSVTRLIGGYGVVIPSDSQVIEVELVDAEHSFRQDYMSNLTKLTLQLGVRKSLPKLSKLRSLKLYGWHEYRWLTFTLDDYPVLRNLSIRCYMPLRRSEHCSQLIKLDLGYGTGQYEVNWIAGCTNLIKLRVSYFPTKVDLSPWSELVNLETFKTGTKRGVLKRYGLPYHMRSITNSTGY